MIELAWRWCRDPRHRPRPAADTCRPPTRACSPGARRRAHRLPRRRRRAHPRRVHRRAARRPPRRTRRLDPPRPHPRRAATPPATSPPGCGGPAPSTPNPAGGPPRSHPAGCAPATPSPPTPNAPPGTMPTATPWQRRATLPPHKPTLHLGVLVDVSGSMDPYAAADVLGRRGSSPTPPAAPTPSPPPSPSATPSPCSSRPAPAPPRCWTCSRRRHRAPSPKRSNSPTSCSTCATAATLRMLAVVSDGDYADHRPRPSGSSPPCTAPAAPCCGSRTDTGCPAHLHRHHHHHRRRPGRRDRPHRRRRRHRPEPRIDQHSPSNPAH